MPPGFVTWMKALVPAPGAGLTVPEIEIVCASPTMLGDAETDTVAAAAGEISGESARNATSIPAAIVGSAFIWITEC